MHGDRYPPQHVLYGQQAAVAGQQYDCSPTPPGPTQTQHWLPGAQQPPAQLVQSVGQGQAAMQTPSQHCSPAGQHASPQAVSPDEHPSQFALQTPSQHCWPEGQALPQAPQLAASFCVSAHMPSGQQVSLALQLLGMSPHVWVAGSQTPQLESQAMQTPPQHDKLPAQPTHVPFGPQNSQLSASQVSAQASCCGSQIVQLSQATMQALPQHSCPAGQFVTQAAMSGSQTWHAVHWTQVPPQHV